MSNFNTESIISLGSKDDDVSPFNIKKFETKER